MDTAYEMTEIFLISFYLRLFLSLSAPHLFSGSVSVCIILCMQTVAESALDKRPNC